MGAFELFMKKNKLPRENAFYAATKSLKDADGEPLRWELRAITTAEAEQVRLSCTARAPDGSYVRTWDFIPKLCALAVVYPDLCDAELQDSYGVCTPHELLTELLDEPGEFNAFVGFVRRHSGLDITAKEAYKEAKN